MNPLISELANTQRRVRNLELRLDDLSDEQTQLLNCIAELKSQSLEMQRTLIFMRLKQPRLSRPPLLVVDPAINVGRKKESKSLHHLNYKPIQHFLGKIPHFLTKFFL